MKILVTGGAGFIGSNFILRHLKEHPEDELICLDKLTYAANLSALAPVMENENFTFIREDIVDRDAMLRIFKEHRPEAVVNFAAETHVDRAIASPDVFTRTNFDGTASLLEAARLCGVSRFHQISTDEVYGASKDGDACADESAPLLPSSPYSASKAAADLLALSYYKTYGLHVTVSRSSNNYGKFQYPEKLIPRTILRALSGREIPIYGNGQNRRTWISAEDHCDAIERILESGAAGEIYNVSTTDEFSNLDLVKRILFLLGKSEEMIRFVPDRPGHDFSYRIDCTKIRTTLGFRRITDFSEGLADTVRWYRENAMRWGSISLD